MKMGSFFYQVNNPMIMDTKNDDVGSNSSISSDLDSGLGSDSDSDLDLFEEVNSSSSNSSLSSSASSSTSPTRNTTKRSMDALHDMSSLLQQLPIKRGLSKHYNGRSQSFTSLSNVRSLEDLAKPEHPYNKKLKTCKSYQAFYYPNNNNNSNLQPGGGGGGGGGVGGGGGGGSANNKIIKKASLCTKRNNSSNGSFKIGINVNRPLTTSPIPPLPPVVPYKSQSSGNFNRQSSLFALGV